MTNEYDRFNQLVKAVAGDMTIINSYNGEGLREAKTVNGIMTRYLYEYDKVILETDASGKNVTARNIYGTNLLARMVENEVYYYLYNGHADVTGLVNAATGTVDATYYYDAFGNILESAGDVNNNITYAGYQYDEETGLYYLNARMYDPRIARFLQEDTYRGDPNDPLSLNLYTYCVNNPLIYYDPTGHFNIFSGEDWRKFASNAKEVGIGIADGTMRFVSGNTYQSVDAFVNDIKWAFNNSEYLGDGTVSYISETASNIKQGAVNFANDVKWAYKNRDIFAETINEGIQQFKSDVRWAIDNRSMVVETVNEMTIKAINDFNSKSLREKTAIITDVSLNVASFIGVPEAAITKVAQIQKIDKLYDAANLLNRMDDLYDAGIGMKKLDGFIDTVTALRKSDNLVEVSTGIRFVDNIDDFGTLTRNGDSFLEGTSSLTGKGSRFGGDAKVVESYWNEYYAKVGQQGDDIGNLISSAQKRSYGKGNLIVEDLGYSGYNNGRIAVGSNTKRWEFIEEFLHYKVDNNQALSSIRKKIKKEIKRMGYGNYGRVSEEIAVKQWMLNKSNFLKLDEATQTLLKCQIEQLRRYGIEHGY